MLLEFFIPVAVLKYRAGRIGIKVLDGNGFLFGTGFAGFFNRLDPNFNYGIVINCFHGGAIGWRMN